MDASSPELMLAFYNRLYPYESIFRWLNQDTVAKRLFTHREFAFTLAGDVYLRYLSFNNSEELKKEICRLNPSRFEIGPVYSTRPRDRKMARPGKFIPTQRELVFDIDMTDYDPVRTCCSKAAMCKRCWGFIVAAVQVIDESIREEFGYEHLLWVYSGRRGIHLWISDEEALNLTNEQRKAMVNRLAIIHEGKKGNVRTAGRLPPSLRLSLEKLADVFVDLILDDQDCFNTMQGYEDLLKLIPEKWVVEALRTQWDSDPSRGSPEKWKDFKNQIKKTEKGSAQRVTLTAAMEDIILLYTYPRLDAAVSKARNHLLKAPFCIHPGTGRVCVPIDPQRIAEFEPEAVPTVTQLLEELNNVEGDASRTSLQPYVEMMDQHVNAIMRSTRGKILKASEGKTDLSW